MPYFHRLFFFQPHVHCIIHQKGLRLKIIIRMENDFTHAKKKSVMLIRARIIDNTTASSLCGVNKQTDFSSGITAGYIRSKGWKLTA